MKKARAEIAKLKENKKNNFFLAFSVKMRYNDSKETQKEDIAMERVEKAYAKINLFLDVLGRRADGMHDLRTVMQTVSLFDTVSVRAKEADYSCITLQMENSDIPADERNLAYLAAEAFLEETGISAAVAITVDKRIPVAAGLAGGSADAAAVLRAMNAVFGEPLLRERLLSVASRLGADVPFCLVGGTALCEGKGEQMTPYEVADAFFVIAQPEAEKMATPRAYAMLDEAFGGFENEDAVLHDALFSFFAEDGVDGMYNVFESVVIPHTPAVAALRTRLISLGAKNAMMSGSGTAVFGVFESEEAARYAAEDITGAFVCAPVPALL